GARTLRRARILAGKLADRKDWPADLSTCGDLPEVKAFREALHLDATPALNLLHHPRIAVRVAALAALEFRTNWRAGQTQLVLQEDGPLRPGQLLAPDTVADLNAWASDKGILAVRAAQSLGAHYLASLSEQPDGSLLDELQKKVADPHAPPVLRMELAGILRT